MIIPLIYSQKIDLKICQCLIFIIMPVDKIVFTFNKFYFDLLKDLKKSSDELRSDIKKNHAVRDDESRENIDFVANKLDDAMLKAAIEARTDDLGDLPILKKYTLNKVLLMTSDADNVKSYVYILVLLVYLDKNRTEKVFETVMAALKAIQTGADHKEFTDKLTDDDIVALVDNVAAVFPKKAGAGSGGLDPSQLENTKIGAIAKEIAADMDLSGINLSKPEDILKGNGDLIGKIVSNVSSKLEAKFKDGSIKHDELLSEAMSVIGGLGGENGNMFANIMKQLAGMAGMAGMAGAGSDAKRRSSSAAKKLRKRLAEK